MALSKRQRAKVEQLNAEAVREVGVLLVAFSPLDAAFAGPGWAIGATGLIFLLLGLLLFSIGTRMELRRETDRRR